MRWTSARVTRAALAAWFWSLCLGTPSARADLASQVNVGEAIAVENLTLFPLLAKNEADVGPLVTLEAALKSGHAEVRELGREPPNARNPMRSDGAGAQVNTLVLENKGKVPIYVLAGTVVKGGQQDRQIGQDFIVEPGAVASVDAFCVEHGRWTNERAGVATQGKFSTAKSLATSDVRSAGQYAQNQGEVWEKVSGVNRAHKKSAPSDTLNATLDDREVAGRTRALAQQIEQGLVRGEASGPVVGFAYALDGEMRSVRFFASRRVFGLFRESLVEAAALDALTAQAQHGKRTAPPVAKGKVSELAEQVDKTRESRVRDTKGANVNEYKESNAGYGSKTRLKSRPASAPAVSEDYVSK